ncbi:MAG: XdhC family protein [Janthinobacterium lividum]
MKELEEIVGAWNAVCAEGREVLLATVVQVSGSTYRRPGARMLLASEGRLAGSVSGGCLEGDLVKKAQWRTRDGAALVTYDSTDEDDVVWGFGLGCNGVVQVLLERVSPEAPGPLGLLQAVLTERQPGVAATVIDGENEECIGERLLLMPNGSLVGTIQDAALSAQIEADAYAVLAAQKSQTQAYTLPGGRTAIVFLEAVLPPMPLVIFGANHDALPLVRLAKELGWHVTVADTRAAQARPERFPDADAVLAGPIETVVGGAGLTAQTAVVVMTHNYPDDKRVLRRLLETPVSYIGQLGPRARTERLLAEISDDGLQINEDQRSRLHGPVGLDLGADTPEQIALSIIAEIQAVHAGRTGGYLRDRRASLHPHPTLTAAVPSQQRVQATCAI